MPLSAYLSDGGPLRRVTDPSAEEVRKAVWLDLLRASPREVMLVAESLRWHVPSREEVSEIEASSRLATRDGALYLSLPMVSLADGPRSASAGFVVSADRLMTVRFHDSRIFDGLPERLGHAGAGSALEVFVGLLEAIVDRQADALEQGRAELDDISHRIFAMGVSNAGGRKQEDAALRRALGQLGEMADLLSHVRETQTGLARMVPYVQTAARDWLPAALAPRLDVLERDINSIASFDNFINEKLQFLLDATLGFINIAQNNVMKVLTIASVVGIPPVLVAGIYGMNFKNMPELDWHWGYQFGWAMIILTTLIPLALFRWKKWI